MINYIVEYLCSCFDRLANWNNQLDFRFEPWLFQVDHRLRIIIQNRVYNKKV